MTRIVGWVALVASWAMMVTPGLAAAQSDPDLPTLPASIQRQPDGDLTVALEVPEGWSLYTQDPGPLGLPLELVWTLGDRSVEPALRWPRGTPYETPVGTARVWREPVMGVASADDPALDPESGRLLRLEVRWALCRADLCVPGRTRAEHPPR